MDKNFDFNRCEAEINAKWLGGNMFAASVNPNKKPYTVIMPPPNITSRLHIGHAFTSTIQDAIIRFKRMQGYEALLLPGADHAAIATEAKVVDELRKQGIEKSSLTREQFMEHIQKWYDLYTAQIIEQFKRLGMSCDWNRFRFTMDDQTTLAVKTVFKNWQDRGLIYRGERMTNWCPNCKTALSDAEIEHKASVRQLVEIKYGDIVVATTRPETMFGDVAVAVNPNDKRYAHLIGKSVDLPLTGRKIPVIADEYVDIKFGTGALKITPAHDLNDYNIGIKHGLKFVKVIDEDGKLFGDFVPQQFRGMYARDASKAVVRELGNQGVLGKVKPYQSNVGKCYRCQNDAEIALSNQWFVAMKDLAKPCIEALDKDLFIVPKKYKKTYLHWLNNIKDWCISRQLISGHRIPVDGETDVLDTWFSSALWPFCTLGWPNTDSADYKYFYPTQTLVSAYDILFFWIVRMVFSGIDQTGQVPFNTALFHGLVRDNKGIKMSKSLGNGVDPIEVIDKYGTDALRFSLVSGTRLDRDSRYGMEKAELARNFINKIWNATKFYKMLEDKEVRVADYSLADKWILTKLQSVIKNTTKKYEKFDFGLATAKLQGFFWNDFCDWYIEAAKVAPNKRIFGYVLASFLKLINPIMPFVTEQIYCNELGLGESLLREIFPTENKKMSFPKEKKEFDKIIEMVSVIRNAKKETPGFKGVVLHEAFVAHQLVIEKLTGVKTTVGAKFEIIADKEATESARQVKIAKLKAEIARGEAMLANAGFVSKAPKQKIDDEKQKLADNKKMLAELEGGKQ